MDRFQAPLRRFFNSQINNLSKYHENSLFICGLSLNYFTFDSLLFKISTSTSFSKLSKRSIYFENFQGFETISFMPPYNNRTASSLMLFNLDFEEIDTLPEDEEDFRIGVQSLQQNKVIIDLSKNRFLVEGHSSVDFVTEFKRAGFLEKQARSMSSIQMPNLSPKRIRTADDDKPILMPIILFEINGFEGKALLATDFVHHSVLSKQFRNMSRVISKRGNTDDESDGMNKKEDNVIVKKVKIQNIEFNAKFVTSESMYPGIHAILGLRFLVENEAVLDFKAGTVTLKKNRISRFYKPRASDNFKFQ